MNTRTIRRAFPFALLLVVGVGSLWGGQATNGAGKISGYVVDPQGNRVSGVVVEWVLSNDRVVAACTSGTAGDFRLQQETPVEPGPHEGAAKLVARKAGFAPTRIAVPDGPEREAVMISLQLDTVAASVTVSAEVLRADLTTRIPQKVNVIGQSELLRRAYWNASSLASEESGVAVQFTSPSLGGVFIRGMSGDDVPVFYDGVRVSTSAARGGINTFFNLNDSSALQVVELLRGPNTGQYGSDSLGGVVHLTPRDAGFSGSRPSTHVEWGTALESAMNAFGSDLSIAHSRRRVGLVANLATRRVNTLRTGGEVDSHSALTRFLGIPSSVLYDRIPDTAFTQYGGMIHGQLATTDNSQFVFHYHRSQQDGGKRPDQLLSGDGNLIADLRNLMADLAYLRYQAFPDRWIDQVSITGSFLAQREERRNQGGQGNAKSSVRSEFERTSVWGTSAVLGRNRGHNYSLAFGGDRYMESLQSTGLSLDPISGEEQRIRARIPDKARYTQTGAFFQGAITPFGQRLRLSGALRLHRATYRVKAQDAPVVDGAPLFAADSLSVGNVSGRVGAVYLLGAGFRLRGYYARGFRAPTVTNLGTLGFTGNGYEIGSADLAGRNALVGSTAGDDAVSTGAAVQQLKPELSDNYDAGVSWENGRIRFDLTGFWIERSDVLAKRSLILPQGAVGSFLGDQPIIAQDSSGIVFVPLVPNPVLVRANADAARFRGVEQELRLLLGNRWTFSTIGSYVRAEDRATGLPPDISAGVPAPNVATSLRYMGPNGRCWVDMTADGNFRQDRISSVGLTDRRVGATRTRSSISRYFANGAAAQGLIDPGPDEIFGSGDDLLRPTGETLTQVQRRVLGGASSAPLFDAIPGYLLLHVRAGFRVGESSTLLVGLENLTDRNYRGMAWGIDGKGRSLAVQWRMRF